MGHILLRNHSGDEERAQKRARRKYEIASWGKPAPSLELIVSIQEYMWAPRLLSETFHDNQLQGHHVLTHNLLLNRAKDLSFLMYSESLSKHRMTLKSVEFSVGHLVQWVRSQCKHLLKMRTSVESPYCRPGAWGCNNGGTHRVLGTALCQCFLDLRDCVGKIIVTNIVGTSTLATSQVIVDVILFRWVP